MVTRIVKMCFRESEINNFKNLFEQVKLPILSCEGCISVKLLQSKDEPQFIFTLSKWNEEKDLENYRQSELFLNTWKITRLMFEGKAEAWTLYDL
ncbi:MAG: antibiotic biosynthesis monooxygenase [Saprospiraceae bacterium]|nr:antibiotic biosynthesis monooxygenase [Saprospiraceae bacterium]